jgi:hypothetical protein
MVTDFSCFALVKKIGDDKSFIDLRLRQMTYRLRSKESCGLATVPSQSKVNFVGIRVKKLIQHIGQLKI